MNENVIFFVVNDSYNIIAGPFHLEADASAWKAQYRHVAKIQRYRLEETW